MAAVCREAEAQQRDAVRAEEAAGHRCQSQPHTGNLSFIKKLLRWLRVNSLCRSVNTEAQKGTNGQEGKQQPRGKVAVGICFCFVSRLILNYYFLKSSCGLGVFFLRRSFLMNDFLPTPRPSVGKKQKWDSE